MISIFLFFAKWDTSKFFHPVRLFRPCTFINFMEMCSPVRLIGGVRLLGTLEYEVQYDGFCSNLTWSLSICINSNFMTVTSALEFC